MATIADLQLTDEHKRALELLKERLTRKFPIREMIIFGSVARNQAGPESDLDLLVITERPFSHAERHLISDEIFEVNLDYGMEITSVVVDAAEWYKGPLSVSLLYDEVERDGVKV